MKFYFHGNSNIQTFTIRVLRTLGYKVRYNYTPVSESKKIIRDQLETNNRILIYTYKHNK